jgi:DNA polymerase I-like protein with 3'-5' exonuclease and polymerase domains
MDTACNARQSRVNLQLHDALIVSVYPEEAYYCMTALVDILEKSHNYYGELLSIPAEIKLGTAWGLGDIGGWKQLPERDEVEECIRAMH